MLSRLLLATVLALVAVPRPAAAQLGSGCSSGALFSSIACRIDSLLAWAQGSGPPITVQKKLQKLLLKAKNKVAAANRLVGKHRVKPAHAQLGKADRNLAKVDNLLTSVVANPTVRARGVPPTATPAEALAFCEGIRTDVATVQTTLVVKGPIIFAEICCVRICLPTQADPAPCSIVNVEPCDSPACAAIASCVANGCEPLPAPIGTTCAQLYANICSASATCDAYNPTCVAPAQ